MTEAEHQDAKQQTQTETVKVQVPKGARRPNVSVIVNQEITEPVQGFVTFLREHAVVGLAVGFIIGQQAQALIKQLVDSFVTPLLSIMMGENLKNKTVEVYVGNPPYPSITWGMFLYVFINFIFVLVTVYVVIKVLKLD